MQDHFYSSIATIMGRLERGETTALALARAVLERIARYNGPLNAVSDLVEERTLAEARAVDEARKAGRYLGPLAGLPVAIKDIIDTRSAVCSAGLPFLQDYYPSTDATVVQRLRQAGAVIIGVTSSDPGAFGVRTDATNHPQAPGHTVGGSSGGSAAALAAGFAWAALGTDTGGSVRIPAACCLTASLKPTHGRVPDAGVRPLAWTLDHVGSMTRRVGDIAVFHGCLDPDFGQTRSGIDLSRARVGIDHDFYAEADEPVHKAMETMVAVCESLGCTVVPVRLPAPADTLKVHSALLSIDSAAYYEEAGLADHPDMPPLPRVVIDAARKGTGIEYAHAARLRRRMQAQVNALFDEQVDFLLVPTLPVVTPRQSDTSIVLDGTETDYTLALVRYTHLFNHTGHPAVALPASVQGPGIGTGVQVVARHHRDADAVAFAERLESALALNIDWTIRQQT